MILYQLLTGRFPYAVVGNIRDVIDNILTADPAKPSTIDRRVDNEVETIVLKCMAKEPDRRYQSAGELARDVRRYLAGEPIAAKQDSGWYILRKAVHRHRVAAGVIAGFLVLSVAFGVTMSVLYRRAQLETRRTKQTLGFLQDTLFAASSKRLGSDATLVEALDLAAERVANEFADQPVIEAALRYTLGSAYETLWQKETAVDHLRIARDLNRQVLGPDHPDTMRCTVLLGMVLAELQDAESVKLQREALRVRLKRYGDQHRLVAQSKSELAFALFVAASPPQWEQAGRYFQEALETYSQTIGPEHEDIARSLHEFAIMRQFEGSIEEAERLFRQSLAMSRSLLGDDHQFVMECISDFADVLQLLGKFDEAESMLQQVRARTARLFGRIWLPRILRRLASLQQSKGDLAAAERTIREALAAVCEQLGGRHPGQAQRLEGLAESLMAYEPLAPVDPGSLPPEPRAEWNPDLSGARANALSPEPRALACAESRIPEQGKGQTPPYCQAVLAISELSQDPQSAAALFTTLMAIIEDFYSPDEADRLLSECVDVLRQAGLDPATPAG